MGKKPPGVYYADYLGLDRLLDCQNLESVKDGKKVHDELLFIVVHQAYELWFKQVLWELDATLEIFERDAVDDREMGRLVAHLRRIVEIQRLLLVQVDVLETMTPLDFLDFRDYLVPASGLQSAQFRLIENKLGIPTGIRVPVNQASYLTRFSDEDQRRIRKSEEDPSLLELVDRWLARTPFLNFGDFDFWSHYRAAVDQMLKDGRAGIEKSSTTDDEKKARIARHEGTVRNFETIFFEEKYLELREKGARRLSHKSLLAALLINLYRDEPVLHLPFRLLTSLMDIDEGFTNWRYRHALMVLRMIGNKMGTGGTSGTDYLRETAERHKVFTDLFDLSTYFIPRSALPTLPEDVMRKMAFRYADG